MDELPCSVGQTFSFGICSGHTVVVSYLTYKDSKFEEIGKPPDGTPVQASPPCPHGMGPFDTAGSTMHYARLNDMAYGIVARLVMLLCCLHALNVQAQTTTPAPPEDTPINLDCTDLFPDDKAPKPTPDFFSFLDAPQKTISSSIESVARSIDGFFANEKVNYESSGSYVRYSIQSLFEEGGRTTTTGNLDLSLHLPRTEQKLRLVVESDPIEKQTNLQRATTGTTDETEKSYYAGLQSEFGKEDKWRFKPSVGIKLRSPIEYYFRARAYRDVNFDKWNLRLTESAYWFHSTGAGFDSEMQWNHLLAENWLFRADTLVRNTEEYHRFDLSQIFYLVNSLSKRRAITYSIGFFGNTEPNLHATDYILQARYRQIIQGDYLFMELVPQIRYRIDNAFTQEDSFLLRFEWLFKQSP